MKITDILRGGIEVHLNDGYLLLLFPALYDDEDDSDDEDSSDDDEDEYSSEPPTIDGSEPYGPLIGGMDEDPPEDTPSLGEDDGSEDRKHYNRARKDTRCKYIGSFNGDEAAVMISQVSKPLTVTRVGKMLGSHTATIKNWVKAKTLPLVAGGKRNSKGGPVAASEVRPFDVWSLLVFGKVVSFVESDLKDALEILMSGIASDLDNKFHNAVGAKIEMLESGTIN